MDQESGPRFSLRVLPLSHASSSLSSLRNGPRPLLPSSVRVKQQEGARPRPRTLGMCRSGSLAHSHADSGRQSLENHGGNTRSSCGVLLGEPRPTGCEPSLYTLACLESRSEGWSQVLNW